MYAQPLYMANVSIGGGTHNVVFVVTMNDTIYAFDADNSGCVVYWHISYVNASAGVTTMSSANAGCSDMLVQYGITGTPVIDPSNQMIYFVDQHHRKWRLLSAPACREYHQRQRSRIRGER